MQRHHRALAEADQRQRALVESAPRQFRVEKSVEGRAGGDDAPPALVGIAHGERKPLPPHGRGGAALACVRRDEIGVRQQAAPLPADLDQIVPVRAIAVQKHHELPRLAGFRLKSRAVDRDRHAPCL